ncbi:MAG: CBS domain-containing protein [Candidatus Syntropharchaeia archaeon]
MDSMELTPVQREVLTALISIYHQKGRAVKGEEIAELVNRNPGTIRNQMQALKMLKLVEGVPGPKGGYKATGKAYEVLSMEKPEKEEIVPVSRNGYEIEGVTVESIEFKMVRHPDVCRVSLKMLGNIKDFAVGDIIEIGPTPVNKVVITGEVLGRDDTENTLFCSVSRMISLPKKMVKDYLEEDKLVTVPANASIQEAAQILLKNNVDRALVTSRNSITGLISFKDIGKAVASGKLHSKVRDLATKEVIAIEGERSVYDAVQIINRYGIGSVLVTVDGVPKGLLPRTVLLREFAIYR